MEKIEKWYVPVYEDRPCPSLAGYEARVYRGRRCLAIVACADRSEAVRAAVRVARNVFAVERANTAKLPAATQTYADSLALMLDRAAQPTSH